MHHITKIAASTVNEHLACGLCFGYLIDATTIIECLHSFCRSCIVQYLAENNSCPLCGQLVHKTRPLVNIRSDKTLQTLVYKLIPGLFLGEMQRRREFYANHPEAVPDSNAPNVSEERGEVVEESWLTHESKEIEQISVCLQHTNLFSSPDDKLPSSNDERYLLCPAYTTVHHLKKFIRYKFELPTDYQIEIYYSDEYLDSSYTLLDVASLYSWRRVKPLKMCYVAFDASPASVESLRRRRSITTSDDSLLNLSVLIFRDLPEETTTRKRSDAEQSTSDVVKRRRLDVVDFDRTNDHELVSREIYSTASVDRRPRRAVRKYRRPSSGRRDSGGRDVAVFENDGRECVGGESDGTQETSSPPHSLRLSLFRPYVAGPYVRTLNTSEKSTAEKDEDENSARESKRPENESKRHENESKRHENESKRHENERIVLERLKALHYVSRTGAASGKDKIASSEKRTSCTFLSTIASTATINGEPRSIWSVLPTLVAQTTEAVSTTSKSIPPSTTLDGKRTKYSTGPFSIYEDLPASARVERSDSIPTTKVGIVISRGKAMPLQDKHLHTALRKDNNSRFSPDPAQLLGSEPKKTSSSSSSGSRYPENHKRCENLKKSPGGAGVVSERLFESAIDSKRKTAALPFRNGNALSSSSGAAALYSCRPLQTHAQALNVVRADNSRFVFDGSYDNNRALARDGHARPEMTLT